MGLDMYLTGRKFFWHTYPDRAVDRKEDGFGVKSLDIELGYWRKHPNLHGYIVQQFANGVDDCQEIELSAENLRAIIAAVKLKNLPQTSGFFFGESDESAAQRKVDVGVFEEALDWLQASDAGPIEIEPIGSGIGVIFKPNPEAANDTRQRVSRSVHYMASW